MRRQIMNWSRPVSPAKAKARALAADFGRNVRARRLAAGLRQKDLARICHVGAVHICHIETGRTNPMLETMALLADGLGCTVADLMIPASARLIQAEDVERAREAMKALGVILGGNSS